MQGWNKTWLSSSVEDSAPARSPCLAGIEYYLVHRSLVTKGYIRDETTYRSPSPIDGSDGNWCLFKPKALSAHLQKDHQAKHSKEPSNSAVNFSLNNTV